MNVDNETAVFIFPAEPTSGKFGANMNLAALVAVERFGEILTASRDDECFLWFFFGCCEDQSAASVQNVCRLAAIQESLIQYVAKFTNITSQEFQAVENKLAA